MIAGLAGEPALAGLESLSAVELIDGYRSKRFSPVEVIDALAARIERVDPLVGAFTTLCLERARDEALAAQRSYAHGEPDGPLLGVPFAAKDIYDSKGVRTTYGSVMFSQHVPADDAEAVRRTRAAGGIMIGKTATHEFAWGITSINHGMGTSRNPWEFDRISGGSSGGSAAALAARLVPLALGPDTGGSIRIPSAFCGTVGLKPTYGSVDLTGAWPLAPTLDHAGPMARSVADAQLLFAVLTGRHPAAPVALSRWTANTDGAALDLRRVRIGLCQSLHQPALSPDIQTVFDTAASTLKSLGAQLIEVDLRRAERIYPTYTVIQQVEALRVHRRAGLFPASQDQYGEDVRARLQAATHVTSEDHRQSRREREDIRTQFAQVFQHVDLLLTPVSPVSPPLIGDERRAGSPDQIPFRDCVMPYTVPQSLAGLPAAAVPAGFDKSGIPVGIQLTGGWHDDTRLLQVAAAFTAATGLLLGDKVLMTSNPQGLSPYQSISSLLQGSFGHVGEIDTLVALRERLHRAGSP